MTVRSNPMDMTGENKEASFKGGKRVDWKRLVVKTLVAASILLFSALGIHYRPAPNFNYAAAGALKTENGITKVDFDFLGGFDYEKDQKIPARVKELDGKKIGITGFMLPVDFDSGVVKSFMLLNNQMGCCFGVMPRVNDFIYVEMPEGKSTKYMTDIPLRVTGELRVGKENLVGGLYTMTADKVETVRNY